MLFISDMISLKLCVQFLTIWMVVFIAIAFIALKINLYGASTSEDNFITSNINFSTSGNNSTNSTTYDNNSTVSENSSTAEDQSHWLRGYVYAVRYWEQQSNAAYNLMTLQCWTGHLNVPMSVVAPFFSSGWPITTSQKQQEMATQFSDLFHLEAWNNVTKRQYGVELVSWSNFTNETRIKFITVQIIYWWDKSKNSRHLSRTSRIMHGCRWRIENDDSIFQSSFHIVRRACINFSYGDKLTSQEFNDLVFGSYSPNEVSVVFEEWRSISPNANRIPINLNCGPLDSLYGKASAPSSMVQKLAFNYKQLYFNNSDYIAVMVRLEKAALIRTLPQLEAFLDIVLNTSRNLHYQYGISNTLLSIDVGRFGSSTLTNEHIKLLGISFFEKVTENKTSLSIWEQSFEDVAKTAEPAIIARLQSTLVTQSSCAIIAGGGMFQFQTALMYRTFHKNNNSCLKEISLYL